MCSDKSDFRKDLISFMRAQDILSYHLSEDFCLWSVKSPIEERVESDLNLGSNSNQYVLYVREGPFYIVTFYLKEVS